MSHPYVQTIFLLYYLFWMIKKKSGPKRGTRYIGTNKYPFGRQLAKIRISKGYTQAELAELSGLSRRVISSLEREVQNPSSETVKKVAEALKVPVEQLLFAENNKSNDVKLIDKSLYKRFKLAQKLPKRARDDIKRYIDNLIKINSIEKNNEH